MNLTRRYNSSYWWCMHIDNNWPVIYFISYYMRGSTKFRQGSWIFLVLNLFQKGPYGPPARSNWTRWVQLLLEVGSVPVFWRKPIVTCDFNGVGGGGGGPTVSPLDPSIYKLTWRRLGYDMSSIVRPSMVYFSSSMSRIELKTGVKVKICRTISSFQYPKWSIGIRYGILKPCRCSIHFEILQTAPPPKPYVVLNGNLDGDIRAITKIVSFWYPRQQSWQTSWIFETTSYTEPICRIEPKLGGRHQSTRRFRIIKWFRLGIQDGRLLEIL